MMRLETWRARKALVVAVMGCLSMIQAAGQDKAQSTARTVAAKKDGRAEVDAHAAEWLKESDVPSAAVAYIEDRKVAWTAVYGEQSPGVPATAKTLYNMASLTKPVTAEAVLRLASAGKLSLDESMFRYWLDPDIKDDPRSRSLTPRLCLSHQTGFPNWRGKTGGVLKIQWDPGTQTGYSGEGFNYVGRFAEKKLGKPFDVLAQEMVFNPIGMNETSYTAKNWYAGRLAVPHGPKRDKPVDDVATTWDGADLLRTTYGMGLGWEVETVNGEKILDHDGSDWGVKTFVMFVPSRGIGVVVFTNGENGNAVIKKVVEALYPNGLYVATM
jgi:CubicO group peptidase (beta-lactamase class C family)